MRKILLLGLLLLPVACSEAQAPVAVGYAMPGPFRLDVQTISVIDRSVPVQDSPYATNNFQPTVASAIRGWANANLIAAGTSGEAVVVIKDASLRSKFLEPKEDWWTRPQAWQYIAHAAVEITVSGRNGYGHALAEASHFETLPQSPSADEKQNAYNIVLNGLMQDLGTHLGSSIQQHLGAFLISAPQADQPAPLPAAVMPPLAPLPVAPPPVAPTPLAKPATPPVPPAVTVYPVP